MKANKRIRRYRNIKKYFIFFTSTGEKDRTNGIHGYFFSDFPKTARQLIQEAESQVKNSKYAVSGETYKTMLTSISEITLKQ